LQAVKRLNISQGTAMDAGCGPGRTSYELAREFEHVEALDWSQGFVDMLNKNKSEFLRD
jgi:2-polyprenyl-3-methyl-5-hydroxy-6-metoxy-1,4-benzoquinol methylase